MNYYPMHLGDYAAHAGHLEPMEDLAYRRMLDAYYLREGPLPSDPAAVARLVRLRAHAAEVEAVLREFFTETPEGWRHERCEEEIAAFRAKQEQQSRAGRASAEKRQAKVQGDGGVPQSAGPAFPALPDGGEAAEAQGATGVQRALNAGSTGVQRPFNGRSTNQNQNQNQIEPPNPPAAAGGAPVVDSASLARQLMAFFPERRRTHTVEVCMHLTELIACGHATPAQLLAAAAAQQPLLAKDDGRSCPSVRSWLRQQRWRDVEVSVGPGVDADWRSSRSGVEAMGERLGLGRWCQDADRLFSAYESRVVAAFERQFGAVPA